MGAPQTVSPELRRPWSRCGCPLERSNEREQGNRPLTSAISSLARAVGMPALERPFLAGYRAGRPRRLPRDSRARRSRRDRRGAVDHRAVRGEFGILFSIRRARSRNRAMSSAAMSSRRCGGAAGARDPRRLAALHGGRRRRRHRRHAPHRHHPPPGRRQSDRHHRRRAPWWFLAVPVAAGAATLVICAALYHRWISDHAYP